MNSISKLSIKPQSTIETCLSVCLISLLENHGIKIEHDEEINILIEGLKFTKIDYSTGHLVYVCKKYGVEGKQYIDNPIFYQRLSKYKYSNSVKLINKYIDRKLISKMKVELPFIIYIDQFYTGGLHLPHFVILEKFDEISSEILDPWDGKRKKISTEILSRSIQSLRNKLKISPKIITLS